MNLKLIRNTIVYNLYKYTGVPVIEMEQTSKKPNYPFIGYKFIVPYNKDKTQGIFDEKLIPSLNKNFEYDIEETVIFQPKITLSITVYSNDSLEAQELANRAHDWFVHVGYYDLADINVTVVDTLAFGDRTLLIVDDYEHRVGFDTILRTVDEIKRVVETIEDYTLEEV